MYIGDVDNYIYIMEVGEEKFVIETALLGC